MLMGLRCCVFMTDIYVITHKHQHAGSRVNFSVLFLKLDHFSVIKNLLYFDRVVKWPLGGVVFHKSIQK